MSDERTTSGYELVASRHWQDDYPDRLTISLERSSQDGEPFVVISGQAVWLHPAQVAEVIAWLEELNDQSMTLRGLPKAELGP